MVNRVYFTTRFLNGLAELKSKHKKREIEELHKIIPKLENMQITTEYSNHHLSGTRYNDLHISPDVILLYRYDDNDEILMVDLELSSIVNHDNLDRELKNLSKNKRVKKIEDAPIDIDNL